MDLFIIKKIIIIIIQEKKKTKHTTITIHNIGSSSFQTGFILKQFSKIRHQMLQSCSLLRHLQVPSSSTRLPPATHPPTPPPPLPHSPHLFICTITDRYQVTGESVNEEAMLAFHVAASLIAAFTAKDDCRRVQRRIFRSALRCDCAA